MNHPEVVAQLCAVMGDVSHNTIVHSELRENISHLDERRTEGIEA